MPVSRRGARSRIDPISPVILLGGIGCSVIEWENNIGALARQHKVYALDMLGDGLTDKPQGDRYALKDRAKFTCDFLQEMGEKRAHFGSQARSTAGANFFAGTWRPGDKSFGF
jgi:pimeloyl-ACP methyl ester carboxylesterase